jgi:hypothetical protein
MEYCQIQYIYLLEKGEDRPDELRSPIVERTPPQMGSIDIILDSIEGTFGGISSKKVRVRMMRLML